MTECIVFEQVRVFDGTRMLPEHTVIVRESTIAAVGSDLPRPSDALVIDGTGLTLLPGLIDAHTHTFGVSGLQQALIFGVTTELDMFTDWRLAKQIKGLQAQEEKGELADLRSAGTAATASGGHGTQFGPGIPTITTPGEAQAFVDARIAEGSDYLKIMYDDGKAVGKLMPMIGRETMIALVEAAHQREKLAVAHIMTLQQAWEVLEAGIDGLAHLFLDSAPDSTFGRFVVERRAFVIPTLSVLESVCNRQGGATLASDAFLLPYLSTEDVTSLQRQANDVSRMPGLSYAFAEEAIRQLREVGARILAGTDAPMPGTVHGVSLHRELELLVDAGLTPLEALAAATSVPADAFGLQDRGRIAPGLRADLLLVEGDPGSDILATRHIHGVWKRGKPVDRAAYRARLVQPESRAK